MLQIFTAGKQTDNRGVTRDYPVDILHEIANSYDFKKHRAPILTGHNENQPNKGLIASLKVLGDKLFAIPRNVLPEFKESVNREEWAGVSPRLYHPDDPANPNPGKWGLRHLAFLQIPAVKGMALPEFSEHPDWDVEFCFGEISFSGWMDSAIATVFRNFRDWLIEEKGLEAADKIIPGYLIESLIVEPIYERMEENKPLNYGENNVTEEELNRRIAEVEAREAAIAQREHQAKVRTEFSEWIEPLIAAGKVLPAEKAQLVATMVALSGDAKVEFGEGDDAQSLSLVDAFKKSLEARAKIIEYTEQGKSTERDVLANSGQADPRFAMRIRAEVEKAKADGLEISYTEAAEKLGGRR